MTLRIRHTFNHYLGHWDPQRRGYFAELVPAAHWFGCTCRECRPTPPKPAYRAYDTLDAKQARLFWK
jgi:hypothetical protein